ncbi:MAG: hypothetical protein M1510_04620, partial [Nitrospirae bacterium]|nr:hypothetical protein [Nitrospirota bacterium]
QHVFSNTSIPVSIKDNAFMHGFIVVMGVLLLLNLLSAFLSTANKSSVVDAEAAEAAKEFVDGA